MVNTLSLDQGYCPDCRDKVIKVEEEQVEMARQAGIVSKRRKWRESSGIPTLFMGKDFSSFDQALQPTAFERAAGFAKEYPLTSPRGYGSLLLYSEGTWGVGKTHLACGIIHHILGRWAGEEISNPCHFVTEPDLFRSIQATYNYSSDEKIFRDSEDDIYRRLTRVPLLVIDDIGKEQRQDPRQRGSTSDFVQRVLFAIIDGRYKNTLPLVLTSNLGPEKLEAYLGGVGTNEASFDRITEMTGGEFFRLTGESFRRKV